MAKPSRLYCNHCDETLSLPQNGNIKLYQVKYRDGESTSKQPIKLRFSLWPLFWKDVIFQSFHQLPPLGLVGLLGAFLFYNLHDARQLIFQELQCPLDGFEILYFTAGAKGKSYVFCPYCYNNPPFRDMVKGKTSGCNSCTHPTCPHGQTFQVIEIIR